MKAPRFELIVNNENHEVYVDSDIAPKSYEELANDAAKIQKTMDATLPGGTWTVCIFRHAEGSAYRVVDVNATGKVTISIPQAEQMERAGNMIRFRNEKERMIAIALLTAAGMNGLKKQMAEETLTLTFADKATARQAMGALEGYDLADLRQKTLR